MFTRICGEGDGQVSFPAVPRESCGRNGGGGATHHQTQVALREVDHGRVEVCALVECGRHDGGREGRGGLLDSIKLAVSSPINHLARQ